MLNPHYHIFILLIFCVCGCYDRKTAVYSNYEEVVASGSIERGWVPLILPEGAFSIQETHDLDTNEGSGIFSFTQKDEKLFRGNLGDPIAKSGTGIITYKYEHFYIDVDWVRKQAEFRIDRKSLEGKIFVDPKYY